MSSILKYGPMRNYISMYERKNHSMPQGLSRSKSLEMPMGVEHIFSPSKKVGKNKHSPDYSPGIYYP